MPRLRNQDKTAATSVLGVKRQTASHELDDAATKEEPKAKSIGKHVELGKFFKYEVGLVGRNARSCVFDSETHGVVDGINAQGDTALMGKVEGVEKKLRENNEQMMAVGLDCDRISDMTVQMHLDSRRNEAAGIVKGLTGQLIAADDIIGADGLMAFDE